MMTMRRRTVGRMGFGVEEISCDGYLDNWKDVTSDEYLQNTLQLVTF